MLATNDWVKKLYNATTRDLPDEESCEIPARHKISRLIGCVKVDSSVYQHESQNYTLQRWRSKCSDSN